jgi:hypothetical protein
VINRAAARYRAAVHTLPLVKRLMPADGSLVGLVAAVAAHRSRPIDLLPAQLGARSSSGCWVAGTNHDYIVYAASAAPEQRDLVVCHELAHMLLGHPGLSPIEALGEGGIVPARTQLVTRHPYGVSPEAEARRLAERMLALATVRRTSGGTPRAGARPRRRGEHRRAGRGPR